MWPSPRALSRWQGGPDKWQAAVVKFLALDISREWSWVSRAGRAQTGQQAPGASALERDVGSEPVGRGREGAQGPRGAQMGLPGWGRDAGGEGRDRAPARAVPGTGRAARRPAWPALASVEEPGPPGPRRPLVGRRSRMKSEEREGGPRVCEERGEEGGREPGAAEQGLQDPVSAHSALRVLLPGDSAPPAGCSAALGVSWENKKRRVGT